MAAGNEIQNVGCSMMGCGCLLVIFGISFPFIAAMVAMAMGY